MRKTLRRCSNWHRRSTQSKRLPTTLRKNWLTNWHWHRPKKIRRHMPPALRCSTPPAPAFFVAFSIDSSFQRLQISQREEKGQLPIVFCFDHQGRMLMRQGSQLKTTTPQKPPSAHNKFIKNTTHHRWPGIFYPTKPIFSDKKTTPKAPTARHGICARVVLCCFFGSMQHFHTQENHRFCRFSIGAA
jgi:hypothetical protein